jgi:hypothetical protein
VRRVSLCQTLLDRCGAVGGPACPIGTPAECPAPAALDVSAVDFTTIFAGAPTADLAAPGAWVDQYQTCHMEKFTWWEDPQDPTWEPADGSAERPEDPCPHWQYYPAAPRRKTEPQPPPYPCPNCPFQQSPPSLTARASERPTAVTGDLHIEIDPAFTGRQLTSPTLKCGGETFNLTVRVDTQAPGFKAVVKGITCQGTEPMQLSFTLDGTSSATSPIAVVPAPAEVER